MLKKVQLKIQKTQPEYFYFWKSLGRHIQKALYQASKEDRKIDLKNLQDCVFGLIGEFYKLDLFENMEDGELQKMFLDIYGSNYLSTKFGLDYQSSLSTVSHGSLTGESKIAKYLSAEQSQKLSEILKEYTLKYPKLSTDSAADLSFDLSIFELIMILPENNKKNLEIAFDEVVLEIVQNNLIKGVRLDGRDMHTTRKISCDTNILPQTHGSSLFERGETQVLNVLTLGTLSDAQILDDMENIEEHTKRYMHHYNFPPYSVGETGRFGSPGRREIGHGALAEKALVPVIPSEEEFPYTIRLVSEVLGSNGSSSMASTCASSLSLMQAGVPIKKAIGGVAMGLVIDKSNKMKQKQLKRDLQTLKEIKIVNI